MAALASSAVNKDGFHSNDFFMIVAQKNFSVQFLLNGINKEFVPIQGTNPDLNFVVHLFTEYQNYLTNHPQLFSPSPNQPFAVLLKKHVCRVSSGRSIIPSILVRIFKYIPIFKFSLKKCMPINDTSTVPNQT